MRNLSNENIIHVKKNGIEFLQFKRLLEYKELNHCYTLKGESMNFKAYHDGTNEQKETLLNNYKILCNVLDINYNKLTKPYQTHTNIVKKVIKDDYNTPNIYTGDYLNVDGLVTNYRNLPIATTNGDCILLLLYDPSNHVIANVHSGWRGTASKIILNAIKVMEEDFQSNPNNIVCCICPSIRVCHFEVDEDVKEIFENNFSNYNAYSFIKAGRISDGKQKYNIDTVLLNKLMLINAGVLEENIIDSGICSVCNSDLVHSRRADGENFNLGTAIIELKSE